MLVFGVRVTHGHEGMRVSDEGEAACSDEGEGEAVQTPQRVHISGRSILISSYFLGAL